MRVKVYATLRDLLGTSGLDLDLADRTAAGQVLQQLAARYPALANKLWRADGQLTGYVTVLVNGRALQYLQGLETPVSNDDTLSLFPPVGGG